MDEQALLADRQAKDAYFRTHPQSPLTPSQRVEFTGLDYFPPNAALRFVLAADEFDDKDEVLMPVTGDNPPRPYLKWGTLAFEVDGTPVELVLLYSEDNDYFFLGFWDATSGTDTYGGGRYLDPERLADGRFHVDFNRAYNPYCAYNSRWSCVLPLPENRLPVRIEAGEKAFAGGDDSEH